MDTYTEINATITDRAGNTETVYAGSVPTWSLINGNADPEWRKAYRKTLLADRTADTQGWRVTFKAGRTV